MNLLIYRLFTNGGKTYVNTVSAYQEALDWLTADPLNTFEKDFIEYKETTDKKPKAKGKKLFKNT